MRELVVECATRGEPVVQLVDTGALPAVLTCVVGTVTTDPIDALDAMLVELRHRTSRTALRELGRDEGYRIEDITACVLAVPPGLPGAQLAAWLGRRLGRTVEAIAGATLALAAVIAGRSGRAPERVRYARGADGRVRVEAF